MIEDIKPVELLTVADLKAHPVWEFLNDYEFGEITVRPVESIPVETLVNRILGCQVRLASGLKAWAIIGNFDVTNPRSTQHFMSLSFERGGEWFHLSRYFDFRFAYEGPEALARFLGLGINDVFPITVDVRRYVRGDPRALIAIVLKEPQEKLTDEELTTLAVRGTR